jgi:hypothetical protein
MPKSQMSAREFRESRLRGLAKRLGFILRKAEARKLSSGKKGRYALIDAAENRVVLGGRCGAGLDEVEAHLTFIRYQPGRSW